MKEDIKLPEGWKRAKLEDSLAYVIGGDWGRDETFDDPNFGKAYCIRGSEIKNWESDKGKTASLRKIKIPNIEKRKLIEGDILVEISGGGPEQPVGRTILIDRTALSHHPEIPKICTNFLRLIRPKEDIDSKFLNLYLKLFYYSGEIVKYQGGSNNLRNLKFPDYLKISIPLPPKNIQQAIVSKIEELFSELDKGIENLRIAQQQLKTYRQAVLKWAFEGRLTNKNVKDGELPEGWKWEKIENVSSVGTGATPLKSNLKYYGGTIPWVTSGALNTEYVKVATDFVTDVAVKNTNLSIYPKHTLLVAMYGEGKTRGKCSELLIEACTNQAVAAISFVHHDISIKPYLKYFLIKNYDDIRKKSSGGVQPNLNLGIIKKIRFPFAPFKEQNTIVQGIENRLSLADKLVESISQNLQQSEALRQSILKMAFEGRLI
jgi:type I restriction enzyme S subunit